MKDAEREAEEHAQYYRRSEGESMAAIAKETYLAGHAAGYRRGSEAAAKDVEQYGLKIFVQNPECDAEMSLRHCSVLLQAFANRIRALAADEGGSRE